MSWIMILCISLPVAWTLVDGFKTEEYVSLDKNNASCRCNTNGFHSLICENITNLNTLVGFLRKAAAENLFEVSIRHSTLATMPLGIINLLGYLFLNLEKVKLKTLFDATPEGRVSIEQLHLNDINVENPITWQPLASLMDLKRLSIWDMPVKVVNKSLVSYVSNTLQSFTLASTGTEEISSTAFSELSELVYISIQNTDIQNLQRSMFPVPAKIRYFYFGKNKISYLPDNLFDHMPDLRRVGIQDNAISEIQIGTFGKIWNHLTAIFLAGNPIKCQCKMSWIVKENRPSILTGKCHAPKDKYGKKLKKLTKYDFLCRRDFG